MKKIKIALASVAVLAIMFVAFSAFQADKTSKTAFTPIYYWDATASEWTTEEPDGGANCDDLGSVRCTFEITSSTPSQYQSFGNAIAVVEANLTNINGSFEVLDGANGNLNTHIILHKKAN